MQKETVSPLAAVPGVYPAQIQQWMKQLREGAERGVSNGRCDLSRLTTKAKAPSKKGVTADINTKPPP